MRTNANGCRLYLDDSAASVQWRHPLEAAQSPHLIDVTDLSDADFEALFVTML